MHPALLEADVRLRSMLAAITSKDPQGRPTDVIIRQQLNHAISEIVITGEMVWLVHDVWAAASATFGSSRRPGTNAVGQLIVAVNRLRAAIATSEPTPQALKIRDQQTP